MLDSLAPARRRTLLLVAALLALALLVAAVTAAVSAFDDPVPVDQDARGPVLLLSGYGGNTAALRPLATALEEDGREVVVVPPVDRNTGDLDLQAEALAGIAEELLEAGAPSLDVVGFSAGGLVARLWVRDHGGVEAARRVLTVGTPHHGTLVAGLAVEAGCSEACRQLAPESGLLRALNAGDETPDGPQYVSVWSTTDQVVTPPETSRLDGAAVNLAVQSLCPDARTSHGGLTSDPVVLALLGTALGPDRPVAPAAGSVDC